ncbi:MAG: hypothetical protein ACK5U7_07645 [Bacteroidota bacterium]|jgi:hypothetical protein
MSIPTPPPVNTTNLNIDAPVTGNAIATYNNDGAGLNVRRALDVQVSEKSLVAITVVQAKSAMRDRQRSLQDKLKEATATHTQLSSSIKASFQGWTRRAAGTLATDFGPFTGLASSFIAASPEITQPESPLIDWTLGTATTTVTYVYKATRNEDAEGVSITIRRRVVESIPPDVMALRAELDQATAEITKLNEEITRIRKVLANPAAIQELAEAGIAEAMLTKTGDAALTTQLKKMATDNVDAIVDTLS